MAQFDVPELFYYYSSLGDERRREWFRTLLVDNRIWFRSPSTLNDIAELRPRMILAGPEKDLRKFAHDLLKSRAPVRLAPAKRLHEVRKYLHMLQTHPDLLTEQVRELLSRLGLLSLSATATDHLMWAHYADAHRGVCIQFVSEVGLFLAAQPVSYVDEAPLINRLVDDSDVILQKSMYTKRRNWAYEQEWRVVARWQDADRQQRYLEQHETTPALRRFWESQNGSGYYEFPREGISKVILGARATVEVANWVRQILDEQRYQIPLVQANLENDGAISVP